MPRKDRAKNVRAKRKYRASRAIYAVALTLLCVAVLAYFFWPRPEYVSVKGGVAIVDSFYSLDPSFTDEAVAFFKSKGIHVDVYKDSEVTVEFYRRLPTYGYNLIILRVHAGILERDPTSPTFLFTKESYETGKYVMEQLTEQVMSGVIDPDNPNEKSVFTVGPLFVSMSMKGRFNDSVIVLSSCLGLYNTQLAEAFIHKGAKAFISWDEKVSLQHTDKACMLLLKTLIEDRVTIDEAVRRVMKTVGPDQSYHSTLKYYPKEAGSLKLVL